MLLISHRNHTIIRYAIKSDLFGHSVDLMYPHGTDDDYLRRRALQYNECNHMFYDE